MGVLARWEQARIEELADDPNWHRAKDAEEGPTSVIPAQKEILKSLADFVSSDESTSTTMDFVTWGKQRTFIRNIAKQMQIDIEVRRVDDRDDDTILCLTKSAQFVPEQAREAYRALCSLPVQAAGKKSKMVFSEALQKYRTRYYKDKFHFKPTTFEGEVKDLCCEYLRGLQWVLHYYYDGLVSWSWFYPYHYTPLLHGLFACDFSCVF